MDTVVIEKKRNRDTPLLPVSVRFRTIGERWRYSWLAVTITRGSGMGSK